MRKYIISTKLWVFPYHLRNLEKEEQGNFHIFQPMKKGKFIVLKQYINRREKITKNPCARV